MTTVRFRFFRHFDWLGPNPKCVLCKLAIYAFQKTAPGQTIDVPAEAAHAAESAGAGERVTE